MGEPADVEISPKKIKKSRWGPIAENEPSETETMGKPTEEPQKVIPNGTGNGIQENLPEKTPIKEKQQKTIKITKVNCVYVPNTPADTKDCGLKIDSHELAAVL
ncbi:hypothetical protein J6590_022672 [Homalodisca vitripennis]|nr:hypothetical protein J6590_022672 [Homalodisca vitripennis]